MTQTLITTPLGLNGPTVSAVGIGAWAWGDKLFWGYGDTYGPDQVREAFLAAVDAGVTFFDTAEIYGFGQSETLLGQFMKQCDRPIDIATKYGPVPWRFTPSAIHEALTASLQRLQQPVVTLYQVHWPFIFFMTQETLMNALADEVERGRIKTIGVSNYSADEMRQAHQILARRNIPLAVNQVRYSLLSRQIESQGILATAQELGITLLAYSPLAQGLLTGKYTSPNPPQANGARRFDPRFSPQGLAKIRPLLDQLQQLGEKYSKTPAQISLNWLMAQGNIIPIPGAKNANQARQNAGAIGWRLAPDDITLLSNLSRPWLP